MNKNGGHGWPTGYVYCRLNTIRNQMNYFTTWEQINSIHSVKYNVQLTTYAVGNPQPSICYTQKTFFFSEEFYVVPNVNATLKKLHPNNRLPSEQITSTAHFIVGISPVSRRLSCHQCERNGWFLFNLLFFSNYEILERPLKYELREGAWGDFFA